MPRRYGTPLPPLARRPFLPRPHLPRGGEAWRASLRKGGTWARITLVIGLFAVIFTTVSAALTPPVRPHLDLVGSPVSLGTVTVERPKGWALAAETADLSRPVVLFAPQADAALPPITITIYAVDASDHYNAALKAAGATAPSDYDLLSTLVSAYAAEYKLPPPKMSLNTYNSTTSSSVVRVDLIAEWDKPFPWRPTGTAAPVATASATATPEPSATATPEPSATVRPLAYPPLGSPVPGQEMVIVQAYYLPDGAFFTGTTQDGVITRKMVVMTLSYPAGLDPEIVAEARRSFDRLASTITFG